MVGAPLLPTIAGTETPLSAIILLYPVILGSGTQNITANRDTRYSDGPNKYKGVRQQYIIKYKK